MIDHALILLRDELLSFLLKKISANVTIDNATYVKSLDDISLSDSIGINLDSAKENDESLLKYQMVECRPPAETYRSGKPPVYFKHNILFTCNYLSGSYRLTLHHFFIINQFLRRKNSFCVSCDLPGHPSVSSDIVNSLAAHVTSEKLCRKNNLKSFAKRLNSETFPLEGTKKRGSIF